VRLWLDLLSDLALSVPREYFHVQPQLISYSALLRPDGVPSFFVLADQSLGPGALLFGGVLTVAALAMFSVLLNHGVAQVSLSALIRPAKNVAEQRPSEFGPPAAPTANARREAATASTSRQRPLLNLTAP
jgi:hypothetical protein